MKSSMKIFNLVQIFIIYFEKLKFFLNILFTISDQAYSWIVKAIVYTY